MSIDFLEILSRLHDSSAEFVIVGGVAASMHGSSRVTYDLDIVPSLTPDSWTVVVVSCGPWVHDRVEGLRERHQGYSQPCLLTHHNMAITLASKNPHPIEAFQVRHRILP